MRILVVDDDEIFADGLKMGLVRQGYAVDVVFDGEKAMSRLLMHNDTYDAVILDMDLPFMEGPELCAVIRKEGLKVPILILSGKTDTEDKVRALNAGADDYITKPFSLDEVKARLRALLRRPATVETNELRVGDITLNPLTRKVFIQDKEISLTLKEFTLLEYFMRHPDQVLVRDQILDHVWDFNFSSFSNVIDVHINSLRKKLKSGKSGFLETVRGVGYRFKNAVNPKKK